MKRRLELFFLSLFVTLSCVEESRSPVSSGTSLEAVCLKAVVEGAAAGTRTVLTDEGIEDKVTGITLASYDEDGVLVDTQYYTDCSEMLLYISKSGQNTVYAMANMGDKTSEMPFSMDDIGAVSHVVESYEEVAEKGFPMCAVIDVSTSMTDREIRLVRMFAKVNLRILHTSLSNSNSVSRYAYNLCNLSSYVRQANSRLYPFSDKGSRAADEGDILPLADHMADMNDREAARLHYTDSEIGPGPGYFQDTTIVFYVPENMQGTLLPVNEDPFCKTADNISSINGKDYSPLCTYVELNARKEAVGTGLSGDVTYRFYLGADNVSDFNVERNGRYDVVMDLTEEGFGMENWKIVKGEDWKDTRDLSFRSDSYVIYPGNGKDVFVHYNRNSGPASSSENRPSDWKYVFDEEAMAESGLTVDFNPDVLEVNPDGYKDFLFRFNASDDAEVGAGFTLMVMTEDGALSDRSYIYVAELGEITLDWSRIPQYVAQYGELTVEGVADDTFPLEVTVSDPSVLRFTKLDDERFRFVALEAGDAEISISNSDGTQQCTFPVSVKKPTLHVTTESVALNPDGAPVQVDYSYTDSGGQVLTDFDAAAFSEYLLPSVADSPYFGTAVDESTLSIHIDRLYDEDQVIDVGSSYEITLQARNCPETGTETIRAYVIDPFDDIDVEYHGVVDDYTLFAGDDVDGVLASYFEDFIKDNASFRYEAPVPDADPAYVEADIQPRWSAAWTNSCGVYEVVYDSDDDDSVSGASFIMTQNSGDDLLHSAGKHDILLYVKNRHSAEKIAHVCGAVDVYVHSALGASAEFGSQTCNYKPAGSPASIPSFAEIYNEVVGHEQFVSDSGNRIFYMDVKAEFMTDVSNVLVFSRLLSGARSGSWAYDAINFLTPSVEDGQVNVSTGLLYSVDGFDGDRINVAEEEYGYRKGAGVMLYRALRLQSYDNVPSADDLLTWFLGMTVNGSVSSLFAPCYDIHDMNISSDMTLNEVMRTQPYYFAPSDYPDHVDDDGRGYHVIHFLDKVAPDTGGWINLL